MIKRIKRGGKVSTKSFRLQFAHDPQDAECTNGSPKGGCYAYLCDADGNPLFDEMHPVAQAGCREAVAHGTVNGEKKYPLGVVEEERWRTEPDIWECTCGEEIHHYREYNRSDLKCDACGKIYNGGGQELVHQRFWGEETNEQFCDGELL